MNNYNKLENYNINYLGMPNTNLEKIWAVREGGKIYATKKNLIHCKPNNNSTKKSIEEKFKH